MEEDVSAIEEVGPALSNFERSPLLATSLCSRSFTSFEVSNFHVASTRFWEAVLLPCAVVVVVAFSSCMELWIGQCVSLGCWYAVNYYAMGYTLQVLHPSNSSVERGLLWLSPFGGGLQLCLWSFSSAILEVILLHSLPSPVVAHTVGTVLYATCGCLWLHLWIAPWRCIPEGWRPHQVLRRWAEDRRLNEKRSQAEETNESPRRRMEGTTAAKRSEEGSFAGHAAIAIAGYALLVTLQDPRIRDPRGALPGATAPTKLASQPTLGVSRVPKTLPTLRSPSRSVLVSARPSPTTDKSQSLYIAPPDPDVPSLAPNTEEEAGSKVAADLGPSNESETPARNVSLGQEQDDFNAIATRWAMNSSHSRLSQVQRERAERAGRARKLQATGGFQISSNELEKKSTNASPDSLVPLGALIIVLLMLLDSGKSLEFSMPHLVCYNLLCLRIPDVLGHWVVTAVAALQMPPGATPTAISFAYMGAMQGYLMVLKWVCRHMSAPDMFPRFHFVAQMYYYLFWYMMLMVLAPGGVDDHNFWLMVFFLNGVSLASNAGIWNLLTRAILRPGSVVPDPPLKVLFDSKLAVQDQLADVVSLLVVPAIATSFHICTSLRVPSYPIGPLLSLWQRFLVLLLARLLSGLLTEEIFRRRVDVLNKAEALELQLLPIDGAQNRSRYLSDICIGPKLALEAMRNIERCELYFATVAVVCTFSVFQKGDWPTRYAFIAFGM